MNLRRALVLMTDFGVRDGAVAAMKGVALGVDPALTILDLTHEVPPFNVWEGAYRLFQTHGYWRHDTVFVVVVDPGVGTARKSLAARLRDGQIIVCPDNGLLTWLEPQIDVLREIDETLHRLPGSALSYTFLGRDLYAFVGAKLASGQLEFEALGNETNAITKLEVLEPHFENGVALGAIPVLDVNFGNIWTNIPHAALETLGLRHGDGVEAVILHGDAERFRGIMPYVPSFGAVARGEPLLYINSLLNAAIAINCDNFAHQHGISSGEGWRVQLTRAA
jgi:S-adenosylmethionine hydrolase